MARSLAEAAGANLYEIKPQAAYSRADLNTFLESYDFTGKTIILFATSGGSGLGRTAGDLKPSAPGAVIRDGKLLNGRQSRESLAAWVNSLKI